MKNNSGFSLIELMITLAIAVIIVLVAIPSFQSTIRNNRATTQANNLLTAFVLARSEAIKRGIQVSVCSSTDQALCSGSNNWATGWIVFTDEDGDGLKDAPETILRVWNDLKGDATLNQTDGASNVQYLNTGLVVAPATFAYRLANNNRDICINSTGRANVITGACP